MAEIKELSDDELASVVGGAGEGNAKYPVGTKFIYTDGVQIFIEITDVLGEANGFMMYNFKQYAVVETAAGPYKADEQFFYNIPEMYFDIILEEGYSIYNG